MQESLLDKKKEKKVVFYPQDLVTVLALERTILAKQRTILAEISVLLGITGLGLLVFRFYDQTYVKGVGAFAGIIALVTITRLFHNYRRFKKKIKRMDRKSHIIE